MMNIGKTVQGFLIKTAIEVIQSNPAILKAGIESAHKRTSQIVKDGRADGDATAKLYDVPGDKNLYVTSVWLVVSIDAGAVAGYRSGQIQLRDAGDHVMVNMLRIYTPAIGKTFSLSITYPLKPIRVQPNFDIVVNSADGNMRSVGGFAGYIE